MIQKKFAEPKTPPVISSNGCSFEPIHPFAMRPETDIYRPNFLTTNSVPTMTELKSCILPKTHLPIIERISSIPNIPTLSAHDHKTIVNNNLEKYNISISDEKRPHLAQAKPTDTQIRLPLAPCKPSRRGCASSSRILFRRHICDTAAGRRCNGRRSRARRCASTLG